MTRQFCPVSRSKIKKKLYSPKAKIKKKGFLLFSIEGILIKSVDLPCQESIDYGLRLHIVTELYQTSRIIYLC